MLTMLRQANYFVIAALLHVLLLAIFIFSYEFSYPIMVVENTNQHDVISAVVLGDTEKSKILPQKVQTEKSPEKEVIEKPIVKKVAAKEVIPVKPDVIPLKPKTKKQETKKIIEKKDDEISKKILADIQKHKEKIKKPLPKKTVQKHSTFDKTLKEQAEKSLREQVIAEDIKLQDQLKRQAQGIVNKYAALIKQSIGSHWIWPANVNKHLRCKLNIRVAPGGSVIDVQVVKSSGDLALDRSAKTAVFNASPLPVPKDPKLFDQFRVFDMDVSPKDMINPDA